MGGTNTGLLQQFAFLAAISQQDSLDLAAEALRDGIEINHAERQITKMDNWLKVGHHAATASAF